MVVRERNDDRWCQRSQSQYQYQFHNHHHQQQQQQQQQSQKIGLKSAIKKNSNPLHRQRIVIPHDKFASVIGGRAGCNLAVIRDVTGALLEIEETKIPPNQDRSILVSAETSETTKYAFKLLQTLIDEPNVDLISLLTSNQNKASAFRISQSTMRRSPAANSNAVRPSRQTTPPSRNSTPPSRQPTPPSHQQQHSQVMNDQRASNNGEKNYFSSGGGATRTLSLDSSKVADKKVRNFAEVVAKKPPLPPPSSSALSSNRSNKSVGTSL
jgi:hypothetical protein